MRSASTDRRKALAVGCTAHAVQDGLTAATYVLLPILAQAFGLSYAQVGLFKGAMSLAQALLETSSGFLSERLGEGRSLVFGLVLAGLGYALLAAADEAAPVLGCLLIVGMGGAFQHAPSSTLVSEAFAAGGRRGALGLYNSSGDIGKLAFAGGFSLAIGVGALWQQVAFGYGLAAIAAAVAIGLVLRVLSSSPGEPAGGEARGVPGHGASGWGILDRRRFGTLLLVLFVDNVVQAGVLVFVAFAMTAKGLPLHVATMAAVVVLAGGIVGKAGCGYLAQRTGARNAFVLVQLLTALGLLGVVAAPYWLAFALLLPLGIVCQGSTSITYGLVPDLIHPDRLARGYALTYGSTSLASAAGPFAIGLVADAYGIDGALLLMAALALASAVPAALSPAFE